MPELTPCPLQPFVRTWVRRAVNHRAMPKVVTVNHRAMPKVVTSARRSSLDGRRGYGEYGGHMLKSARSRLWGSTRKRMVQLASSRSTTAGVRFLRRTQRRVVPSELTRMCLASPRRVGWVTAGKGQRRASSGADDGVTTRTKTFVCFLFEFRNPPKTMRKFFGEILQLATQVCAWHVFLPFLFHRLLV